MEKKWKASPISQKRVHVPPKWILAQGKHTSKDITCTPSERIETPNSNPSKKNTLPNPRWTKIPKIFPQKNLDTPENSPAGLENMDLPAGRGSTSLQLWG